MADRFPYHLPLSQLIDWLAGVSCWKWLAPAKTMILFVFPIAKRKSRKNSAKHNHDRFLAIPYDGITQFHTKMRRYENTSEHFRDNDICDKVAVDIHMIFGFYKADEIRSQRMTLPIVF
jgi:hypothetical protein